MFAATLRDAMFGRRQEPVQAAESVYRIWNAAGPLSAFEAYDVAERYACGIEVDAVCTHIASRSALGCDGRADAWELTFDLPLRTGTAHYVVATRRDDDGEVAQGIDIDEYIMPVDAAAVEVRCPREALPIPFRDTTMLPFRDRDMSVGRCESATSDSGEVVWRVTMDDATVHTLPLAA